MRKLLAWLTLYLIITCSLSTVFAILALVYAIFPTQLFEKLLLFFSIGAPLILIGIGIASLLPLSEYAYIRQAGINPAIAREGLRHQRRKREKRELGILLGITGITSLLGIDPWHIFLFFLMPRLGMPIVTSLMAATLVLLTTIYKIQLRQ